MTDRIHKKEKKYVRPPSCPLSSFYSFLLSLSLSHFFWLLIFHARQTTYQGKDLFFFFLPYFLLKLLLIIILLMTLLVTSFLQVDCNKGPASDKAAFASWVKELSIAFKPHGFLLSTAVSPSKKVIDAGKEKLNSVLSYFLFYLLSHCIVIIWPFSPMSVRTFNIEMLAWPHPFILYTYSCYIFYNS